MPSVVQYSLVAYLFYTQWFISLHPCPPRCPSLFHSPHWEPLCRLFSVSVSLLLFLLYSFLVCFRFLYVTSYSMCLSPSDCFTQNSTLHVYPCCCKWEKFTLFLWRETILGGQGGLVGCSPRGCRVRHDLVAEQQRQVFCCICAAHPRSPFTAEGHLGCFRVSAVVDNAAVNIGACMSFQIASLVAQQ